MPLDNELPKMVRDLLKNKDEELLAKDRKYAALKRKYDKLKRTKPTMEVD